MTNLNPKDYKNGQLVKPVTTDATGTPTLTPQPKVIAGAVTGVILVVVVAIIGAVTPDMLKFLGPWGILIFSGLVALGQSLASYIKRPSAEIN